MHVPAEVAHVPRYRRAELARWLGVGTWQPERWCSMAGYAGELSFLELVDVYVATYLRSRGYRWDDLAAVRRVVHGVRGDYPFAWEATIDRHVPLKARPAIHDHLDYADGLACRWYPRGRAVKHLQCCH